MPLMLALLSILLCSSLAQEPEVLTKFDNFLQLNPSPLYELYWVVEGNSINFLLRVETEGWVGFGISPNGLIPDSDVVIGYVDDMTMVPNIDDRRTDPNSRREPTIDHQQDWNLVTGSQAGGFTILELSRLIDTGDTAGDRVIEETVNLLWSIRTDDSTTATHTSRGAQLVVYLLPPATLAPPLNPTTSPNSTSPPGTGVVNFGVIVGGCIAGGLIAMSLVVIITVVVLFFKLKPKTENQRAQPCTGTVRSGGSDMNCTTQYDHNEVTMTRNPAYGLITATSADNEPQYEEYTKYI